MRRLTRGALGALVAAACLTAMVAASTSLGAADRTFVDKAISLNNESLQRATQAQTSSDNYVLDYAEAIVGDRQAANNELAAIAQHANYHSSSPVRSWTPTSPTIPPNKATFSAQPYFQEEIKANQAAVNLYTAEASNGGSDALRQYARNFLPKLQGELKQATHLLQVEKGLHH